MKQCMSETVRCIESLCSDSDFLRNASVHIACGGQGKMDNSILHPLDAGKMSDGELFRAMMDHVHEGIYFIDRKFNVTYWNDSAERITGIPASEILGKISTESILRPVDENGERLTSDRTALKMSMLDGKQREQEVYIRHRDGHRVPVLLRTVPIKKFTKILGVMEVFIDVSIRQEIKNEAEQYKELAFTDKLTGLYNRRYIEEFIKARMDEYLIRGVPFCVMFLDIDHFKQFNDNYGHELGDEVICMVGKACSLMIRSSDLFGRFGGEEFVAVLPGTNEQNMYVIADAMRSIVENTGISSEGEKLKVTISIGATMVRPDDTPETVMKRADELLYKSKEDGRNLVSTG